MDEETVSRLAILLSILEPLLINDLNLERALDMRTIETLVKLCELPSYILSPNNNGEAKLPIYIKYAVRCLTSCMRHPSGIDQLVMHEAGTTNLVQFIDKIRDEEIIANSAKILRIVLREDKYYDQLVKKHSDLANLIAETMQLF